VSRVSLHGVVRWRILTEESAASPEAAVTRDADLLEAVRAGAEPATARIWGNQRCLVVARADRRLPGFAEASALLARSGWPVVVRESGGTAVPHGPGILSLSLAFRPPAGAPCTLESTYDALCAPIEDALGRLGIEAKRGAVLRAFCDGRYDVAVSGRKLAGTAQRWRAGPGGPAPERGAVLAHAVLLVDVDRREVCGAVDRFYVCAGSERRADAEAAITVREALAAAAAPLARAPASELSAAVRDALRAALRARTACA
jgi:lipoate-protein ligase A